MGSSLVSQKNYEGLLLSIHTTFILRWVSSHLYCYAIFMFISWYNSRKRGHAFWDTLYKSQFVTFVGKSKSQLYIHESVLIPAYQENLDWDFGQRKCQKAYLYEFNLFCPFPWSILILYMILLSFTNCSHFWKTEKGFNVQKNTYPIFMKFLK